MKIKKVITTVLSLFVISSIAFLIAREIQNSPKSEAAISIWS